MTCPEGPYGWIGRFARIGVLPTDSDDEALRKETLVLFTGFTALVSFVWVGTYLALGLYLSAAIPFAYQLVCVANLVVFARTKRYRFFRASALAMGLVLPFLLHLSLGGFLPSSGIVAWCFTAPLGGLLFASRRDATRWFGAFLGVLGLALLLEPFLTPVEIPHAIAIAFLALNILGVTATSYLLLLYFGRERDRAAALVEAERERSERLLLNVLPKAIAERLKAGESPIADRASDVGVLFADIVDFTPMSETMRPEEVVEVLDEVFTVFDGLVASHGLEKIKTVGDAYMVASGLLGGGERHAEDLAEAALEMRAAIARQAAARAPDRDRHRPGRRRRDRTTKVHLRPLGRHGQHRGPDGIARGGGRDPGDRAGLPSPRAGVRVPGAGRGRRQGEGPDADLSARHLPGGEAEEPHAVVADARATSVKARYRRTRRIGRQAGHLVVIAGTAAALCLSNSASRRTPVSTQAASTAAS